MSQQSSPTQGRQVLIIGSQGVLGSLLVDAFTATGWAVLRGGRRPDERPDFRHLDLKRTRNGSGSHRRDRPGHQHRPRQRPHRREDGARPRRGAHQRIGPARRGRPSPPLEHYGSERSRGYGRGYRPRAHEPRRRRPRSRPPRGRRNRVRLYRLDQIHERSGWGRLRPPQPERCRAPPHNGRPAARTVRPAPLLRLRGRDGGWLGSIAVDRMVSPFVCIAERGTHRAMLALNKAGLLPACRVLRSGPGPPAPTVATPAGSP